MSAFVDVIFYVICIIAGWIYVTHKNDDPPTNHEAKHSAERF